MAKTLKIITEARRCTICAAELPMRPKPLLQGSRRSCILIIGQAPGLKAHTAGTPWLDASGDRLRDWLGVTADQFYDPDRFALIPMGFCYPGKNKAGNGDAPPRPECAPAWHARLIGAMPDIRLTVLLGRYALAHYLTDQYKTTTDAVRDYRRLLMQNRIVLPHPSPRNNLWLRKNPWFEKRVLPLVKRSVAG